MTKLPHISGRHCVAGLTKKDFLLVRQHGSHMILRRTEPFSQVVVPAHKELDGGTLRAILRHAGIGIDEFLTLL